MIKKNKNKKLKRKIKNSFHGSHDRLTKYQKYNIMVTMQKRASGLQVRRHSFVNFIQNTPLGIMHFRSGKAGDRLTARLRNRLVPDVRLLI